ncbi:hypothetical protein [Calothrix sp. 336/3]|uniref:hypothetical protein n=1 Tax=Calothrix sp. 336/3 TaxID=1337936 RepID=UPI0004E44149|nr:hypothetical protein [Calothrix sp. 336/3]AKG22453.1 hypothetical protein IJ00_15320 [Calothrix sp. 336/3]
MENEIFVYQPGEQHIYDWSGNQLAPEARSYITVNNIVRIQVNDRNLDYWEAVYVQITAIDENDILTATVLDTYRTMVQETDVQDGEILHFPRACVMEIPHTWENNENLVIVENMKTGYGREVTGVFMDEPSS